jgi:hypothetical protein
MTITPLTTSRPGRRKPAHTTMVTSTTTSSSRSRGGFVLAMLALLAAPSSRAAVAMLPVDTTELGADGPRVRAALVQALRTTLRDDLLTIDEGTLPAGAAACAADPGCVAGVAGNDDVDEVLFVRADRIAATADVWGRVTFRIYQSRTGRTVTFEAPVSTTGADRDVRALVVRAFDPARYQGRLDIVGVAEDDVVLVDGLRAARQSLRLRPGRHVVEVLRPDGGRAKTTTDVALDEQVTVDVAPWSLPSTAAPAGPAATPRPWWPLVTHGALAVASTAVLGVFLVRADDPADPVSRDVMVAGGISLAAAIVTSTTAAAFEATRVIASATDAPTTATNADGDRR